jgi:hypothetical protein
MKKMRKISGILVFVLTCDVNGMDMPELGGGIVDTDSPQAVLDTGVNPLDDDELGDAPAIDASSMLSSEIDEMLKDPVKHGASRFQKVLEFCYYVLSHDDIEEIELLASGMSKNQVQIKKNDSVEKFYILGMYIRSLYDPKYCEKRSFFENLIILSVEQAEREAEYRAKQAKQAERLAARRSVVRFDQIGITLGIVNSKYSGLASGYDLYSETEKILKITDQLCNLSQYTEIYGLIKATLSKSDCTDGEKLSQIKIWLESYL